MVCVECGRDLGPTAGTGRPRRYCSRSCQSRAYRRRRDEGRLAVARPASGSGRGGRLLGAARRSAQAGEGEGRARRHEPGLSDVRDRGQASGRVGGGADRRGDLLEVATALADADGIGAVTLRALAHRTGLMPAAVRKEFGSRDRLVAALVQHHFARRRSVSVGPAPVGSAPVGSVSVGSASAVSAPVGFSPAGFAPAGSARSGTREPEPETPVRTLARLAAEEWATYREHPWLVTVLASSRPPLVPAVLDAARASTEAFAALGLDPPSALGRYVALSAYVQGMALLLLAEQGEVAHSGTAYRAWWSEELRRLDRTGARRRHPWLDAASGGKPPESFGKDADTWFRDGLDRVLAGLVAVADHGPPGEPAR